MLYNNDKFVIHISESVAKNMAANSNLGKVLWKTHPPPCDLSPNFLDDVSNDIESIKSCIYQTLRRHMCAGCFLEYFTGPNSPIREQYVSPGYKEPKFFLLGDDVVKISTKTKAAYIRVGEGKRRDYYIEVSKYLVEKRIDQYGRRVWRFPNDLFPADINIFNYSGSSDKFIKQLCYR